MPFTRMRAYFVYKCVSLIGIHVYIYMQSPIHQRIWKALLLFAFQTVGLETEGLHFLCAFVVSFHLFVYSALTLIQNTAYNVYSKCLDTNNLYIFFLASLTSFLLDFFLFLIRNELLNETTITKKQENSFRKVTKTYRICVFCVFDESFSCRWTE